MGTDKEKIEVDLDAIFTFDDDTDKENIVSVDFIKERYDYERFLMPIYIIHFLKFILKIYFKIINKNPNLNYHILFLYYNFEVIFIKDLICKYTSKIHYLV